MARSPDPELRQWWRELIDSFDSDRATVAEFCRRQGVSSASFYAWRRKFADVAAGESQQPAGYSPAFLPVRVVDRNGPDVGLAEADRVQVHLPGGIRVDVPSHERELLLELVTAVARPTEGSP